MVFFDSHVHIYPDYSLDILFDSFWSNSTSFAGAGDYRVMAVMLRSFQDSLSGLLASFSPSAWKICEGPEGSFAARSGEREIIILPARQVAAREKIEALGIFGEKAVPDGLPLDETIRRLSDSGYLPVLAWGLGKWLFKRSRFVRSAIDGASSVRDLMLGDSALRPSFWGTPLPMRLAAGKGLRIIHGSDPLPVKGDEANAGRYASLLNADVNPSAPASSLLNLLLSEDTVVTAVGKRHSPVEMLRHL